VKIDTRWLAEAGRVLGEGCVPGKIYPGEEFEKLKNAIAEGLYQAHKAGWDERAVAYPSPDMWQKTEAKEDGLSAVAPGSE
jgi:hypothetical protein